MLTEPELALRSLCYLVICNTSIGRFLGKSWREKQKGNPPQKKFKLQSASKVGETVPSQTYFERHRLHFLKQNYENRMIVVAPPTFCRQLYTPDQESCGCQHYQSHESRLNSFAAGCLYVTAPKNIKQWLKYLIFFCFCCLAVNFHRIKFLAIATEDKIEVYAWAPKPYHKFMAFKVSTLTVFQPFWWSFNYKFSSSNFCSFEG